MEKFSLSDADRTLVEASDDDFLDAAGAEVLEFALFEEEPNADELRSETRSWLDRQLDALRKVICEHKLVKAVMLMTPAVAAEKIHEVIQQAVEDDETLLLTSVVFLKYTAIHSARYGIEKLCPRQA